MKSSKAFIAFLGLVHSRSVVDTSSICDLECDGTVDFSDQNAASIENGADQYAKIHKSFEYTLASNVFQSSEGESFGPSLQSSESKFLVNFDSKCSYVIKKDEAIMRFIFSGKDSHPSIKNVCLISESTTSTRDSENEIRAVASIIQRRIFPAYLSPKNAPEFAGYCEHSEWGSEMERGFQRDLSTCFSGDIRDSNEESHGGALYKNSDKYNSVLTCIHGYSDEIQCSEELTFGSDDEVLVIESSLTRKKTRDFSFSGNGYIGHLTSLTMDLTTDLSSGSTSLRSSLEAACSMDNISQQPIKFYNLIVAMREASESEISSVYEVLDGVCQNQEDLNAKKLFHDALQSCGDAECVNFGTELILNGVISLEEAREWFLVWSMGSNQITNEGLVSITNILIKFYTNKDIYNKNILSLGAIIRNVCADNEKKCQKFSGVQKALEIIERPILNSCSGDRERTLSALKALGNAGISNNMNSILPRCMQNGDEETVSTALRSLRHFECSTERFEMISNELTNAKELNLERYQVAYLQMWECPSTEALNVAEWIYHNTAFDTVKSLIATHAFSITSSNDPKYFQTKSLLGGLASNIEFNELSHYTQSQYFAFGFGMGGFEVSKIHEPGHWIPRILDGSASFTGSSVGLHIRTQNIENVVLDAMFPVEDNYLTNDPTDEAVAIKLGKRLTPRFTAGLVFNGNDVGALDYDDIENCIGQIKSEIDEIKKMSFYEKLKTAFGYSNAGYLKYFNGEPINVQKEVNIGDYIGVFPTSIGRPIIVSESMLGLGRVKTVGSLSALGFSGTFEPQSTAQVNSKMILGDLSIRMKQEFTADLGVALQATYSSSTGTFELSVDKKTTSEPRDLMVMEKTLYINGNIVPKDGSIESMPIYDSPAMDVALLLETVNDGDTGDYSRIALQSRHQSDHPLVVRTQYDDSNGLLASLTVKGSNDGKEEMYVNYRESDSHLVISVDSGAKQLKLEGQVTKKKFEGQLLNRDFYLPYSAIDLLIQDAASDAETAQKIMKPELTATIDGAQYQLFNIIELRPNRFVHEINANLGDMGSYHIKQEIGRAFPQISLNVYMGPKPDPTFPIDPYIGVKIGVDQKLGQTSGVLAIMSFSMGPQKYGVEGQYLVSDKKGKIVIKTDNILQMMGTSGELEVHLEAKWKSQKNKNSYLLDIKELSIPDFLEIGKRARIQIDTESGTSSHIESDIDFNGRLSYTKIKMSTPFIMDDEEYFFDAESEFDMSEQKNKAVLLMKVTNAYLPGLGGILRGTVIKGEYSLMPNNAQGHFSVENAMAGTHEMGLEYKKSDSNGKAKRSLSAVVKAPTMNTEMAFDGEIEIDRKFNVRIFANPIFANPINQVQFPCQMIYQDNSNPNLDIALQISLTGLMGSDQLGQSDTMTFSLGLVERPEFIYTVNAKMYGEDLIHQIGNAVNFYSGKMVIANSQTQRGFLISASNESNEVAAVEAMVKNDNTDTDTVFRYKFMEDSLKISHNSQDSTSGGDWRNEGTTTVEQHLPIFIDSGINEKYAIEHKLAGSSERVSIELTMKPADGYFVKLNGLLDFDKKSANVRMTQNLMPGKGFDMIGGKAIWDGQKSALHLMISRQGDNGDKGQSRGKLDVKESELAFTFKMKDAVLEQFLPTNIKSKLSWNINSFVIALDHQHSGKAVNNAVAHVKLLATSSKLQFESNIQSAAYKAEHNLLIQGSDFSSLDAPAKITLKRRTKQKPTDLDFVLLIATDAAKTFRLQQQLKFGARDIAALVTYANTGYDYDFVIETKNNWDVSSFPAKLKLSQAIKGRGKAGFTSTTRMENTPTKGTPTQYCQVHLETTPSANTANFKLTWTTDIPFVVQYMKTLEHLEAEGNASWQLPNPSASFTLTAITTGEDAKINFNSELNSLYDFQMKLMADQAFNAFPLINIYAIEISNYNFIGGSKKSETNFIITNDDPYTAQVETYATSLILTSQVPHQNMPLFKDLPSKFTVQLNIPNYIFGDVIFNLLEFGYGIDLDNQMGSLTLTMDDKKADFELQIAEVSSYKIPKKFDINYSHANFGGDYGTYTLNQKVNLKDNAARLTDGRPSLPILDIINDLQLVIPGKNVDIKPRVHFRMENTDRRFSLDLKWKRDEPEDEKSIVVSFQSSAQTAELNTQLYDDMLQKIPFPLAALISITKMAADPFLIGVIHGTASTTSASSGSRRQKFGGEMNFNVVNYFDTDVEFSVKNEYETRNGNFKFISQLDVKCEICQAPEVNHDMLIDWNGADSEVKNQWDFSIEDILSLEAYFTVEAGLSSFEIRGDPFFELQILDESLQQNSLIENVRIEIDFDARDSQSEFTMTLNKFDFEVNRQQYHFQIASGLLKVTKGSQLQITSTITHNIDELSLINVLERSEFIFNIELVNPPAWDFESTLTMKGAARRNQGLELMHEMNAKGTFNPISGQSMLRSGVIAIKANSNVIPNDLKITLRKIGLEQGADSVTEAICDILILNSGEKYKILTKQRLNSNYRTVIDIDWNKEYLIEVFNDVESNSGIKSKIDVTVGNTNYKSNLDCNWSQSRNMYTFDGVYSHNIQEITRVTSIPAKIIVNGRMRTDYLVFKFSSEVGKQGTALAEYDFDISNDQTGMITLQIPGVTNQLVKISTSKTSPGYMVKSQAKSYEFNSVLSVDCKTKRSATQCKIRSQNNLQMKGSSKHAINYNGDVAFAVADESSKVKVQLSFDALGRDVKIDSDFSYKQKEQGSLVVTWNMPSLETAKYIKFGTMLKFPSHRNPSRKMKLTAQFDKMEPMKIEYNDVLLRESKTVGMRMSIGAAMRALETIIGQEPFEYGIPRDSFEWTFNMDSTASKYGLMVSPDRRVYQADVSFNREGVNIIFTQPNKLRYVPTIFSAHCEYIARDNNVNCNIKTEINSIERQIDFTAAHNGGIFELEANVKLDPMAVPTSITFRVIPNNAATVVFARISTENFNVESNTQYTTKQNRYSIQSTNTVTRNGISENFNFGAEFNKNTNIVVLTVKVPSMSTEQVTQIDFNQAASAIKKLFRDSGLQQKSNLMPRIGREMTDDSLLFYVGFGTGERDFFDIGLYIDRRFNDATNEEVATLTGGMSLIARQAVKQAQQTKTIELLGMHGVIKDQTYVQASLFVNENVDKIMTINIDQIGKTIHEGIESNVELFKIAIEGIVKAIQTEGNGKEYVNVLEDYNANMIIALRESLHTIVNDAVSSIKMTNPDQAVKKSDFLVKHILEGVFNEYMILYIVEGLELNELENMLPLDSDDIGDMFGDFGASFYEDYAKNAYKSAIAQFIVITNHEVIITVPIPVSAQDPMSFDIRKAIMESKLFQELMKWSDLQELINIWYKVRAALSKPAGESVPPFTKRAYIVNGRHITTFDGKTFSIQGGNNCNLLLAKDFGRTGSSISLVNGKLNQKIDPNSGFTVEKKGDIITIIAAGRLHGNVAGALGTISDETADDYLNPTSQKDDLASVHGFDSSCSRISNLTSCNKSSQKWKRSEKHRAPCSPVINSNSFEEFAQLEECVQTPNTCDILNLYQMHCRAEGAFIQLKC